MLSQTDASSQRMTTQGKFSDLRWKPYMPSIRSLNGTTALRCSHWLQSAKSIFGTEGRRTLMIELRNREPVADTDASWDLPQSSRLDKPKALEVCGNWRRSWQPPVLRTWVVIRLSIA